MSPKSSKSAVEASSSNPSATNPCAPGTSLVPILPAAAQPIPEAIPTECWPTFCFLTDVHWRTNYILLAEFRREHGHAHVTKALSPRLAVWLNKQEDLYNAFCSTFEGGKAPKTSVEVRSMFDRLEMLRILGVVFLGKGKQRKSNEDKDTTATAPIGVSPAKKRAGTAPTVPVGLGSIATPRSGGSKPENARVPVAAIGVTKSPGVSPAAKRKRHWEANLQKLREFRDTNGHCDPDEANLKSWVYRQRKRLKGDPNGDPTTKAKTAPLTEDEIRRLHDVGIVTLSKKSLKAIAMPEVNAPLKGSYVPKNLRDPERFDIMYERMKEFYEKHGHTIVPEKKEPQLRQFLVDVRKEYKKIKAGAVSPYLTLVRIERLKQINFSFQARTVYTFDDRVKQWQEYRKQSGGKDPRSSSALGLWVCKTRMRYHDTQDGKVPGYTKKELHHLTDEQIGELRRVGFNFGERDYTRVVKTFDQHFQHLLEFKEGTFCEGHWCYLVAYLLNGDLTGRQ